jgi:RNA polymerase sigma factor (sigma-70 family)
MTATQFYNENVGLIHVMSKRGYARLQSAGVGLDYEDVFQEMAITFLKAYEKFDASRGFKFSTYFYMAAFNRLNSWAQAMIDERLNQGVISIQELNRNDEEEEYEDHLMRDDTTPEAHFRVTEFLEHIADKLSPLASLILAWVVTPPPEILTEIRKAEAYALYGRQRGHNARCMADVSPRYVANFIRMISNVSQRETDAALAEIKHLRYSDAKLYLGA